MSLEEAFETRFLNVDLDVRVQYGLEELLKSLKPFVIVLNNTLNDAAVELNQDYASVEDTVEKFVDLVLALPPSARVIWDRCDFRGFDIGIQAGTEPHATHFTLSSRAVSLLASVQAEIAVTVYAPPRTQ